MLVFFYQTLKMFCISNNTFWVWEKHWYRKLSVSTSAFQQTCSRPFDWSPVQMGKSFSLPLLIGDQWIPAGLHRSCENQSQQQVRINPNLMIEFILPAVQTFWAFLEIFLFIHIDQIIIQIKQGQSSIPPPNELGGGIIILARWWLFLINMLVLGQVRHTEYILYWKGCSAELLQYHVF